MKKRILFEISTMLMLSILSIPTFAWVYPDGSQDGLYESYGPRADKLLIHLYADDTTELAALKAGDIDITDCPLSKTTYGELKQWPYNETITVLNYGPEFNLNILDLNVNNNQYLGNLPDPAYPNPVADRDPGTGNPNIGGGAGPANDYNPMSSVYLRRAIAYLVDRPGLIADPAIGIDFGYPMYTTMPAAQPKYLLDVHGDPTMPWAWKYDPAGAVALLDANGFPINIATGYRYWDRNDDGVEQPDEYVELVFYIRSDHPGRNMIGTVLVAEMAAVDLRVNPQFSRSSTTFVKVMVEKDFHLHTGGWSLGVEPDHLVLWSWDYYWHPGFCYNYAGYNVPQFNNATEGMMYANDQAEAVMYAMMAQEAQARYVLGIPFYCSSGNKAFCKTNTGGNLEDTSEGEAWKGVVNVLGHGIDNTWAFMNMHTSDTPYGGGMVIDWAFKVPEVKMLNPIYASWLYDWNVLDQVYESLLVRNPSDLGELLPWIAKAFHLDTYIHPICGECTRIVFTLRDDVMWSDGTPLTVADVHFTLVELWEILLNRGIPGPWWLSNVEDMIDFNILDAYKFEILLDVKSYWTLGWIGGNIILPKHVWKPIAETGPVQDFMPDPNLVGTGPFRYSEYNTVAKYVLMDANPTFHRSAAVACDVTANPENKSKFEPEEGANLTVTLRNLCLRGRIDNLDVNITLVHPNGTQKLQQYRNLTVNLGETLNVTVPVAWKLGMYEVHVAFYGHVFPDCQWFAYSQCWRRIYVTIKEDIEGSTYHDDLDFSLYPYKNQLPTPDFKVDIRDVAIAAKAFGSYPGHPRSRWDPRVDINGDGKVDIRDMAAIARKFGWLE